MLEDTHAPEQMKSVLQARPQSSLLKAICGQLANEWIEWSPILRIRISFIIFKNNFM